MASSPEVGRTVAFLHRGYLARPPEDVAEKLTLLGRETLRSVHEQVVRIALGQVSAATMMAKLGRVKLGAQEYPGGWHPVKIGPEVEFDLEQINGVRELVHGPGFGMTREGYRQMAIDPYAGEDTEQALFKIVSDEGFVHPARVLEVGPVFPGPSVPIEWNIGQLGRDTPVGSRNWQGYYAADDLIKFFSFLEPV
jgi:hypothetical protein